MCVWFSKHSFSGTKGYLCAVYLLHTIYIYVLVSGSLSAPGSQLPLFTKLVDKHSSGYPIHTLTSIVRHRMHEYKWEKKIEKRMNEWDIRRRRHTRTSSLMFLLRKKTLIGYLCFDWGEIWILNSPITTVHINCIYCNLYIMIFLKFQHILTFELFARQRHISPNVCILFSFVL